MTHLYRMKPGLFMIIGLLWFGLLAYASSAQTITDVNHHILSDDPTETIVYTALKKGIVSVKAEIRLINGELRCPNYQKFEDLYLKPLYDRYQKLNGRIYQDYSGLFYLFIELNGVQNGTLKALNEKLLSYQEMIAGFDWSSQGKPLKVVLIGAPDELATEILNQESSLISLEGDHRHVDQSFPNAKMPVVGLNYDNLDRENLKLMVRKLHRKRKKMRLYNVPQDQMLWASLIDLGADFVNSKKTPALLSQTQ